MRFIEVDTIFGVAVASIVSHGVRIRFIEEDANPVIDAGVVYHGVVETDVIEKDAEVGVVGADVVGHGVRIRPFEGDASPAVVVAGVVDHGVGI